jgi:hypothetical protein
MNTANPHSNMTARDRRAAVRMHVCLNLFEECQKVMSEQGWEEFNNALFGDLPDVCTWNEVIDFNENLKDTLIALQIIEKEQTL